MEDVEEKQEEIVLMVAGAMSKTMVDFNFESLVDFTSAGIRRPNHTAQITIDIMFTTHDMALIQQFMGKKLCFRISELTKEDELIISTKKRLAESDG